MDDIVTFGFEDIDICIKVAIYVAGPRGNVHKHVHKERNIGEKVMSCCLLHARRIYFSSGVSYVNGLSSVMIANAFYMKSWKKVK